jgi:SAM-dependent methyltransferase
MPEDPLSAEFFEAKYQNAVDPWDFATSPYEQGRYDAILRALPPRRYHRAFEPGCSIGILTERIADLCDHVVASDISPTAVSRTRDRCRSLRNVTVSQGALPGDTPEGDFDLIVFSEIGYYFSATTLRALVSELVEQLVPHGVLLAAHWLGHSPDHVMSGDRVHEIINDAPGLTPLRSQRHECFRINVWIKT